MTAPATDSGRTTPARLAGSALLACQSDERLVRLVRSGHERAFDAIVQRYRKPLVRHCRRILPESRCEDAVQQAFINAHAALIGGDEDVQLKPWLYAITRNAALNMLRQNGWNYEQIPLDFDGVRRPDQVVEQSFQLRQTVAAVNELPERQRDALVMREFEGRSYDEIALALGAGDGAVRQLLNRARVTLRNAATLLTPPPLVARAAASMPHADGRRAAELFAGLGAAGVAKAGATALIAGSLVVGAVEAPSLRDNGKPVRHTAAAAATKPAHDASIALRPSTVATRPSPAATPTHPAARHGRHGQATGDDHSGRGRGDDGSRHRSGSDDSGTSGSGERSGSGGGSGSDDGTRRVSGDDRSSGTSGSGTSGSSDSGSSGSGSDDTGTSDSGTSGSGTSGSGTSGSGTSGSSDSASSGSDDVVATTGSTDSSGSGSSGSGTSGSDGGGDALEH